jgi:hypothetical protein
MNTRNRHALPAVIAALFLTAGCAAGAGSLPPQNSTKYTVANTETFVHLESNLGGVTCTGLQERVLPDGRLEVVANVKNHGERTVRVQANCVFRDAEGFGVGDGTPFQTFELPAGTTETVRFTSKEMKARRYTIGVRAARR